jgi:sporulation protein YlmC with PRC-barrel domain
MKWRTTWQSCLVGLLASGLVALAPVNAPGAGRAGESLKDLGKVERASSLMGQTVRSMVNEKLGKVQELAIDVASGQVLEIIISYDNFGPNQNVAVLPAALVRDPRQGRLLVNVDKDHVKASPRVVLPKHGAPLDTNHLAEVYRHYGAKPFFAAGQFDATTSATRLVRLDRATSMLGRRIINGQGERIAKVDDLMLDLQSGRIVHVVIAPEGQKRGDNELTAVPPTLLRHHESEPVMVLEANRQALLLAPYFKRNQWPVWDAKYASKFYRAFEVEPYFRTDQRTRLDDDRPIAGIVTGRVADGEAGQP